MKIRHKYTGKEISGSFLYWKNAILKNHVEENYEIITKPDLVDILEIQENGDKIFIETLDKRTAIDLYLSKSDQYTIRETDLSNFDNLYRQIEPFKDKLKKSIEAILAQGGYAVITQDTSEIQDEQVSELSSLGYLKNVAPNQYKITQKGKEFAKEQINYKSEKIEMKNTSNDVFIVHGHDEIAQLKVARFINQLGFNPIILHEQASSGKTIIEKIEQYTNVGFGIVLYTPCDIGAKNGNQDDLKFRARQNVVFEHGYLIGKIGRKNVSALVKGDLETPTDISGVVYVSMDSENAWHLKLGKELRNSGYDVDFNKLL